MATEVTSLVVFLQFRVIIQVTREQVFCTAFSRNPRWLKRDLFAALGRTITICLLVLELLID